MHTAPVRLFFKETRGGGGAGAAAWPSPAIFTKKIGFKKPENIFLQKKNTSDLGGVGHAL